MPPGKGLPCGPGAWAPQLLNPAYEGHIAPAVPPSHRGGRLARQGPSNLDLECKAAMQKLLKPSHFDVIQPWLAQASLEAKKDIVKTERQLAAWERDAADNRKAYNLSNEKVLTNMQGRDRLAKAVPVSADRMQADLLKNRHGTDQRDASRHAQRKFFSDFAPIPNTDSVADYFRSGEKPLVSDKAAKVLTEDARRRLQAWQVRGPERNREAAACVMRALRNLSDSVNVMPTYSQHQCYQRPGGQGCTDSLHSYTYSAPRHGRTLPSLQPASRALQYSSSAPAILKPFIDPQEIADVQRPGGYIVQWKDEVPLQMMKNREKGIQSKMASGTSGDYSTTYEAFNNAVAAAR